MHTGPFLKHIEHFYLLIRSFMQHWGNLYYLLWMGAPHAERRTYGTYPLHLETKGREYCCYLSVVRDNILYNDIYKYSINGPCFSKFTWGESLNMGAHTIRGVEWCLAASASVCVPLTALSPPFARMVCVPIMTWGEIIRQAYLKVLITIPKQLRLQDKWRRGHTSYDTKILNCKSWTLSQL